MAKARSKSAAANVPVPQSREEAASFLRQIGEKNRLVASYENRMNNRIARAKEEAEIAAAPHQADIVALEKGLQIWCEANRAALTDGNKVKFADLGTGKVSWRQAPAKVSIKAVEDVLERLKKLGLQRFIRTKEEIDREAMQKEPEIATGVPGVTIKSAGEAFSVEPFEVELSGAAA